jgi:16S rRNA (guanine527-N7)-methyltransferase
MEPFLSIVQRLVQDTASLGVPLSQADAERLVHLLDELERWNHTYNLTAIRKREDMLTHHLLDSLSVHPDLHGVAVADVGTGAGFPGLPLAVVNPERRFTLIDSNGKKVRFVQHAARELRLGNVEGVHGRVEAMKVAQPFDTVVSRAFAQLPDMLTNVEPLCGPDTRVLAMKGKWPQGEIDALPSGWLEQGSHQLTIPGLDEARCVVVLRRSP